MDSQDKGEVADGHGRSIRGRPRSRKITTRNMQLLIDADQISANVVGGGSGVVEGGCTGPELVASGSLCRAVCRPKVLAERTCRHSSGKELCRSCEIDRH